jgi:hypothetical protein
MVVMRTGGLSNASLRQRWVLNREAVEVCRANGVRTSWWLVLGKLVGKAGGFFSVDEGIERKETAPTVLDTRKEEVHLMPNNSE